METVLSGQSGKNNPDESGVELKENLRVTYTVLYAEEDRTSN